MNDVCVWTMGDKHNGEWVSGVYSSMSTAKDEAEKYVEDANKAYAMNDLPCYSEAEERKDGWLWLTKDGKYVRLTRWPVSY